jgi:hypothetical protein
MDNVLLVHSLLGILVILLGGLCVPLHPFWMFIALVIAHGFAAAVRRGSWESTRLCRVGLYTVPLVLVLFGLVVVGQLRI